MSRIVKALLDSPDKGASEARDVLARLWRNILDDIHLSLTAWDSKMSKFLDDPASRLSAGGKSRRRDRGNIVKALTNERMTWGSFLMAIHFLNPVRAKLIVMLDWDHGSTVHSKVIYDRHQKDRISKLPFKSVNEDDINETKLIQNKKEDGGLPVVKLDDDGIGHVVIEGTTYEINPELGMIIPTDFQVTSSGKL